MARVCPKRDRLPSSLLIENASAPELPCAPASCSEPFPIKASDYAAKWIGSGWHTIPASSKIAPPAAVSIVKYIAIES